MKNQGNDFPIIDTGLISLKICCYPMIATCAEAQGKSLAEAYPKPDSVRSGGRKCLALRFSRRIFALCVGMDAIGLGIYAVFAITNFKKYKENELCQEMKIRTSQI